MARVYLLDFSGENRTIKEIHEQSAAVGGASPTVGRQTERIVMNIRTICASLAVAALMTPLAMAWSPAEREVCDRLAERTEKGFEDMLRYDEHHISHFNYKGWELWQIEVPKLLREVAATGNVNLISPGGFSALQAACYYADVELAKVLIRNGAEVNARPGGWQGFGFPGDTPVALLVRGMTAETAEARVEIARMLMEQGANPDADMMHWVWGASAPVTPFCYLTAEPYNNAMRLALLQGSKQDLRSRARTWEMAWSAFTPEIIRILLEGGISPNRSVGSKGETLLLHLIQTGESELLKLALDKGADVRENNILKHYYGGYLFAIPVAETDSAEKAVAVAGMLVKAKADLKQTYNGKSLYGYYSRINTPAAQALCKFFAGKGIRR